MRVVSLVPSLTETLVAWSVPVVGRTRFCLHGECEPLGGTKDPDIAAVVSLAPDLVVANHEENRAEDVAALAAAGLRVLVTEIDDLAGAARELRRLGDAVDRSADADALAGQIERVPRDPPTIKIGCWIWRKPWMAVGTQTYAGDVLVAAGFDNVVIEARYPEIPLREAKQRGAAAALLPDEPYPFSARQVPEAEAVFGPGSAVLMNGHDLTWYGPRAPAGIEAIRELRRTLEAH
jgi:ABC-type Fe3+-hydroxamate transport system substrate-binding protein